jgi:hypothetical protein
MSNISVTTVQSVIDVTETGGITVTTPEGQTINVEVPNSSVNVTNTTDDIIVLTNGTVIQQSGITSVNGQIGPVVVLDTDDISEGTTNKYFSQALARQSLSAGTGISYDSGTGVITNTSINTDTTYTIASASTTGGANLNLVGSDSTTDSVAYKGSGATTVTSTDANTITIASTDTNTTYTQNAIATTGGANLNLVGSDSTTDTIKFAEGTGITVVRTDADTITITNTVPDTNTTYTQNISATSGGANLNLVGSDSTTDTVKFADGTGVTVSYTDANTATIAIGQSVGTGDSPSFAGGTFGNITVGVATDQTITTTSGNLVLDSTSGTITMSSNGTLGFTLAPITGFNPNVDFTGNIVKGVIRAGAGEATGDIWQTSGPAAQSTGISIDNTDKPASRSSLVLRNYGGALAGAVPRLNVIGEAARGTAASPLNLNSGNVLIDIIGNGYTNTGWATDLGATVPALIRLSTAEAWTNGLNNVGTNFQVLLQPTATALTSTTLQNTIQANPQSSTFRSDQFTWFTGKTLPTSQMMSLGPNGNLTVNNASTGASYFQVFKDSNNHVTASISQTRATSASDFASANWITQRSTDGINYTPTLNGDVIGEFKFNGNAYTSTSPGVPGAPGGNVVVAATENWSNTANGTQMLFLAIKAGTLDSYGVFNANPIGSSFTADSFTFRTAAASPVTLATIDSTAATFAQPVGFPVKTVAQWGAITGVAGQQVCVSNSSTSPTQTDDGMMAYWKTNGTPGWYYIHDNRAI